MTARLTSLQIDYAVDQYQNHFERVKVIADQLGQTRQGIYKVLKRAGIDTAKQRYPVTCSACGKPVNRHRARIRRQKWHFCDDDCYFGWLAAGGVHGGKLKMDRHHSRMARSKVRDLFPDLLPGNIIHHKDRNQYNNDVSNLCVFASQGDHVRHHRGFDVKPIWDGR